MPLRDAILRWMCRAYQVSLYAYPPDFRRRYGREMLQLFRDRVRDVVRARGLAGLPGLALHCVSDWLRTTLREGVASMNSSVPVPTPPDRIYDGVPAFYTCGSEIPRPAALVHGGFLSIATFVAVSLLIGIGGAHQPWLIGSHHPSPSHLLPARTEAEPVDIDTEVKARPYPEQPPVSPYFKLMLVLAALDANRDNVISTEEMANAPAALRTLDTDHDGKLSPEECGAHLGDAPDPAAAGKAFMRIHPVLAALDSTRNGEISALEILDSTASLKTLDANGDGRLTENELLPDPATSAALRLMAALDKDGDGSLSMNERSGEIGTRFRDLLDRADRNRDGVVTEEELMAEFRLGGR